MTTLRAAAQQALEALEWHYRQGHSNTLGGFRLKIDEKALRKLRAALAEPEPPPEAQTQAEKVAYCAGWWDALAKAREVALAEPQEPYTGDVTRIIREAGMTFHLGLPHKPVIEQMTRVVDLVYAEASIKATQQFAAPHQRPAEPVQEPVAWGVFGANLHDLFFSEEEAHEMAMLKGDGSTVAPLYTSPPQRKPLTEDTIEALFEAELLALPPYPSATEELPVRLARAIERAHGIGSKT